MRPIDADALKEKIKDWIQEFEGYTYDRAETIRTVLHSVIDDIDEAPTIDAAPVRRGEWVHGKRNGAYGIWCSRCGTGWEESPNYEVIAASHNFCPHCGAYMRGETDAGRPD